MDKQWAPSQAVGAVGEKLFGKVSKIWNHCGARSWEDFHLAGFMTLYPFSVSLQLNVPICLVLWPPPFPTACALGGWTFWLALAPLFSGVWLGLTKEAREWATEAARSWPVPFLGMVHWMGCVPQAEFLFLFVFFFFLWKPSLYDPFPPSIPLR